VKKFFTKAEKNNSNKYLLEENFWAEKKSICGVDEVGRGSLAGPIVTVAAILSTDTYHPLLKDSKLLSKRQIEIIYNFLMKNSVYAIGISNPKTIDFHNIYVATQLSMKKALFHLLHTTKTAPDLIAIDAMPLSLTNTPFSSIPIESWTQGESKSASIAAASIIAKVTRDRIMATMHTSFPSYGLDAHKGYGTTHHVATLKNNGASIIHRQTFIKNFKEELHETSVQQQLFC
jgi:ribonuclease HII